MKVMSYLEFFKKNFGADISESGELEDAIRGTCISMCPQSEISTREKEKMVHILEVVGQTRKLVKSYSRSAADSTMAVPRFLRPYTVLKDTIYYLLTEVIQRNDVPLFVVYDFIDDRLRAVRQDMTIQRLPPEQCIKLLEPMIRFYMYFGYILYEYSINDYDPLLNKKYLLECIKWFLNSCDKMEQTDKQILDLSELFNDLNTKKRNNNFICDRILVESLYILNNLNDASPLYRYFKLPTFYTRHPKLRLSYEIAVANMKGNYIRVCKLAENLCPLTCCALCLYLPELHRQAFKIISHGYSSKQLSIPIKVLHGWLLFNDASEVEQVCTYYGFKVVGDRIRFHKDDFKNDVNVHGPRKKIFADKKLEQVDIFIYGSG